MIIGYSFYRYILDPLLFSLRSTVLKSVPEGGTVLEVASGTGDMGFRLASKLSSYLGVDKNPSMTLGSKKRLSRMNHIMNIEFQNGDGARMTAIRDKQFDIALISLALHEMPDENRLPILKEMKRCAKELLLVDYASPLPGNLKGRILHLVEFLAGGDHYRGFKSYQKQGGLDPLLGAAGLKTIAKDSAIGGGIRVVKAIPV